MGNIWRTGQIIQYFPTKPFFKIHHYLKEPQFFFYDNDYDYNALFNVSNPSQYLSAVIGCGGLRTS